MTKKFQITAEEKELIMKKRKILAAKKNFNEQAILKVIKKDTGKDDMSEALIIFADDYLGHLIEDLYYMLDGSDNINSSIMSALRVMKTAYKGNKGLDELVSLKKDLKDINRRLNTVLKFVVKEDKGIRKYSETL